MSGHIDYFTLLDLYHEPPDSGERQYKSRDQNRRFDSALGGADLERGLVAEHARVPPHAPLLESNQIQESVINLFWYCTEQFLISSTKLNGTTT